MLKPEAVVADYKKGLLGPAIGRKHKVTRERIRQILYANGIFPRDEQRKKTAKKAQAARRMAQTGATREQINKQLGSAAIVYAKGYYVRSCEVCAKKFTLNGRGKQIVCQKCKGKYTYGAGTYWSAFKNLAKKYPEFLNAMTKQERKN